jgi:hypothetical protein
MIRARRALIVAIGVVAAVMSARAQDKPPPPPTAPPLTAAQLNDPRVKLSAGAENAGIAAKHMELVSHLPKPEGFGGISGGLGFANSDFAFQKNTLFLGNFNGFNFYDIEDPRKPRLRLAHPCPGGQGDLSVFRHLLFMSVEATNGRIDCGTQGVQGAISPDRFRGVRIFDITNLDAPQQIAAIQTCRGSHTHTLVVDADDKNNIYIYGSGTSGVRSEKELAGCVGGDPKDNAETALFSIDVIQVPLAAPQTAKIVNRPRIFADPQTGAIAGLWPGGAHGEGTQRTSTTNQCHDITTYPELGLAAGACSGNGILLDISDPVHPVRLDAVVDKNFAYWHSATFNNDGTKIVFTDEWGGGTSPRCRATDLPTWGANAIFDISADRKLTFRSYYKLPAPQTEQENCVAHNGSIVPVPGRDIMVQAWYQGGLSVFDFTDSAKPVEIAFFDRGPIDAGKPVLGGYWSTYWYNGHIYGSEIARGLDIFELKPSEFLSADEIAAAKLVQFDEFNAQHQPRMNWPASFVVARAYLDQLTRSGALQTALANTLRGLMDRAERQAAGARAATLQALDAQSRDLDQMAASASVADARRLHTLAATIRVRAGELRR